MMIVRWLKALRRPVLYWPAIGGIALVVLGILALQAYEQQHNHFYKLLGLFLGEMGFAFLIAVILFITLEEQAGREHSKTVLGYLYGIDPGDAYFKKIEKYIIKCPYFRDKTVVTYHFKERHGESLLVEYTIEYVLKNISREPHDFVIQGSLDKKPIHPASDKWNELLGVRRVERGDGTFGRDDLTIDAGRATSQCELYKAPAITLAPGQELRVRAVHCLVKHDHDSEVWQCSIPCSGVEFRLEWADHLNLEFATEAIHPEPDKMKRDPSPTSIILKLSEPFLLHHGIHFWWAPKGAAPDPAASASGAAAGA